MGGNGKGEPMKAQGGRGNWRAAALMLLMLAVLPFVSGCGLFGPTDAELAQQAIANQSAIAQAGAQAASAQAYSHSEVVISENNKAALLALYAYLGRTGDVPGTLRAAGFSWGSALVGFVAGIIVTFGVLWLMAGRQVQR